MRLVYQARWILARWAWPVVFFGRRPPSEHPDTIDFGVGFTEMARLGDRVDGPARPLAVIRTKDENS